MLVFQYGSNCLEAEINGLKRLCGDAKFVDTARADNFELAFDVMSRNRSCAAADIVPKPGGIVWGVLYEIPDELIYRHTAKLRGRKALDAIEGEGINYERKLIDVSTPNGYRHRALKHIGQCLLKSIS